MLLPVEHLFTISLGCYLFNYVTPLLFPALALFKYVNAYTGWIISVQQNQITSKLSLE